MIHMMMTVVILSVDDSAKSHSYFFPTQESQQALVPGVCPPTSITWGYTYRYFFLCACTNTAYRVNVRYDLRGFRFSHKQKELHPVSDK